jgi:hypothetical protein
MLNLCPPAIIYLIFSATQIIIDTYSGLYNTAIIKVIVTFMVTLLLNILCENGLNVVSWIIVFIPFILMTVIVSVILYFFGLDAASGSTNKKCTDDVTTDSSGNIIIYDPEYNPLINPVYYKSPNIIVPNPNNTTTTTSQNIYIQPQPYWNSTSPAYQS